MSEPSIKLEDWAQGMPMRAGPVSLGLYQPSPETMDYWHGLERRELMLRLAALPDIPTAREAGFPGLDVKGWYGVSAPAGTPKPVVARLNGEILRALKIPEVKDRLENVGFELVGSSPEACGAYIKSEIAKWAKVVKASGVKAE